MKFNDLIGRVHTVKEEIVYAIKEKVAEINNGDAYTPVYLHNVSVAYTAGKYNGVVNTLQLYSIFFDEDDTLCGDFIGKNPEVRDGFIFGKCIEDLHTEDLLNILNNLYQNAGEKAECVPGAGPAVLRDNSDGFKTVIDKYFKKYVNV